jgi:glycosyltransferase involved in cell wall biosynthesis
VTLERVEPSASDAPPEGALENTIWITWERQRRTTELASRLGVTLERLLFRGPGGLRHLVLAGHTWARLLEQRPRLLIVQNPSLILALVASLARRWLSLPVVVDRHTNFGLNQPPSLKKRVFTAISDFTLRNADLTIVTNGPLAAIVEDKGGRSFVLPDPVPTLEETGAFPFEGDRNVCFICTYAMDEPYAELLSIVESLPQDVHVYVTGNPAGGEWSPELMEIRERAPNLTLTGFIDEEDYIALLKGADVIVDLTTFDHCLVCGAYEAIAAGRAMVLSDKQANRELFGDVPVYVNGDGPSILQGLRQALEEAPERSRRVREFQPVYETEWEESLRRLVAIMRDL